MTLGVTDTVSYWLLKIGQKCGEEKINFVFNLNMVKFPLILLSVNYLGSS
jgi:hypothetical protein